MDCGSYGQSHEIRVRLKGFGGPSRSSETIVAICYFSSTLFNRTPLACICKQSTVERVLWLGVRQEAVFSPDLTTTMLVLIYYTTYNTNSTTTTTTTNHTNHNNNNDNNINHIYLVISPPNNKPPPPPPPYK